MLFRIRFSTFVVKQQLRMLSRNIDLGGGVKMPILGFGTWQANDEELDRAVENALLAGYRHIDCAYAYGNEHVIGNVLNRWITSNKIDRKDLFIVTKLPPCGNRPQSVEKYLKKSMKDLQVNYLDQYLVHTPFAFVEVEGNSHPTNEKGEILYEAPTDLLAVWKVSKLIDFERCIDISYDALLKEMEKQVDAGLVKTIGVSNFNIKQIQRILDNARIRPSTLQIEVHLYFQQNELVNFCKKNNISVTAYSPLGSKGLGAIFAKIGSDKVVPDLMDNPVVKEIAAKHKKTPAQVLLRHTIQRGIAAIPKSTNLERLKQNICIFDFSLDEEDVQKMNALDKGPAARVCDFTFFKGLEKHPEFPF